MPRRIPWLTLALALLAFLTGCAQGPFDALWPEPKERFPGVQAPTFSLAPGSYNYEATLSVSLTTSTPGASIKYTTDGTDPKTSPTAVLGSVVPLTTSTSLEAYAFKPGLNDSPETGGTFTVYKTILYWGDTGSNQVFKYEVDMSNGSLGSQAQYSNTISYTNSLVANAAAGELYTACSGSHSLSVFPINTDGSLGSASGVNTIGDSVDRLVLHPTGRWLYGVGSSGPWGEDVTTSMTFSPLFQYYATPLPDTSMFDDVVQPNGNFLYALYRVTHNLACWAINPATGDLTYASEVSSADPGASTVGVLAMHPTQPVLYVVTPWQVNSYSVNTITGALTAGTIDSTHGNAMGIVVDPLGKFLFCANQESSPQPNDAINVYALDATTGQITPNGGTAFYNGAQSGTSNYHLMAVDPTGRYLYDYTDDANKIQVFAINRTTGALTDLGGAITFPGTQAASPVFVRIKQ